MRAPAFRSCVVASTLATIALACAPTLQQRAAPYPAYGQTFQQLQQDSVECERWAQSNAGSGGESLAGGALAGAAIGAALGAATGAFFGAADTGAAVGAALGGTQGAASGAAAYDIRLSAAYQNCMV